MPCKARLRNKEPEIQDPGGEGTASFAGIIACGGSCRARGMWVLPSGFREHLLAGVYAHHSGCAHLIYAGRKYRMLVRRISIVLVLHYIADLGRVYSTP